jgi:phosphatidate cytidylyltransferase
MKRLATAVVLIPVITYLLIGAPYWAFAVVLAAVAALCYIEFEGIVAAHGIARTGPLGFVAGLIVLFARADGFAVFCGIALVGLTLALRSADLRSELPRSAAFVLGMAYIFGTWRCADQLHAISPEWLFYAIALNWVGDSAALFAGRSFGRHKLAPAISPGKTWEGSVASVLGSVIFGLILTRVLLRTEPIWLVAAVGVFANVAGQIGDLCESALKRGAGMKDSGTMLPGHGGWLDRVDSTLFAVPAAYGLLQLARAFKVP